MSARFAISIGPLGEELFQTDGATKCAGEDVSFRNEGVWIGSITSRCFGK